MKRTITLLTVLALMIPGAAVASANSTTGSYAPQSGVQNVTASRAKDTPSASSTPSISSTPSTSNATATEAASTGTLPFTGLDLGALAAGAVVLVAAGLALRRVSAIDRR
jgi:hypothetical protein